MHNLQLCYDIYQEQQDYARIAEVTSRLGYVHSLVDDNSTGQALTQEALQYFRKIRDQLNISETLNNLGAMQWRIGNFDEAKQYYQESLAFAQEIGNQYVIAKATGGLGLVALAHEQWDMALTLIRERQSRMQALGLLDEADASNAMICGIYVRAERYHEAIELSQTHPSIKQVSELAQAYIALGMYETAIEHLLKDTVIDNAFRTLSFLSEYLVCWVMLLISNCRLIRIDTSPTKSQLLADDERVYMAKRVLVFLSDFEGCRAVTRPKVNRLLSQISDEMTDAEIKTIHKQNSNCIIEELAQEMLTLRLG